MKCNLFGFDFDIIYLSPHKLMYRPIDDTQRPEALYCLVFVAHCALLVSISIDNNNRAANAHLAVDVSDLS